MCARMKTACVNKYISGVESTQTHFSCLTAFSTIAWDDLEDCTSAVRPESDPLGSQVRREKKKNSSVPERDDFKFL